MSKREDVAYLAACIKSSHDKMAIEQMFIEIVELLSKGTKYRTDIKEALDHYEKIRGQ